MADNIKALIAAGPGPAPAGLGRYEPMAPGIMVPVGPEGGSGQRPGVDELIPAEVLAAGKGRDMMVGRFAEMLGVPGPDDQPEG